ERPLTAISAIQRPIALLRIDRDRFRRGEVRDVLRIPGDGKRVVRVTVEERDPPQIERSCRFYVLRLAYEMIHQQEDNRKPAQCACEPPSSEEAPGRGDERADRGRLGDEQRGRQ